MSRGDLLDGMMDGQDPLSFIPLAEGANERSGGRVKEWVNSWWNDWGHIPLVEVGKDQWFELKGVDGARLWMPPPAAMETVMDIFNEDRIAHPWNPHVFVVPRLMTHLWRKSLGKDADVIFNVKVGNHFWGSSQHEPLIVAIVLPIAHVSNYRGPWIAKGTPEAEKLTTELDAGFKYAFNRKHPGLSELDGALCGLWEDPEGRSRHLLQEFLCFAGEFPPVQECLVRRMLSGEPSRPVSPTAGHRRSRGRRFADRRRQGAPVSKRQRR